MGLTVRFGRRTGFADECTTSKVVTVRLRINFRGVLVRMSARDLSLR